jgi:hypothetical protein
MRRILCVLLLGVASAGGGCKKVDKAMDTTPKANEGPKLDPYNAPGGSGGATQAVRGAVARAVTGNDLKNLHLFIESASGASGQMPSKQTIIDSLKASPDAKNLVALIEDGSIVLTGIRQREGIWAYEKLAIERGGNVISNNGVERMAPNELKDKLKAQ